MHNWWPTMTHLFCVIISSLSSSPCSLWSKPFYCFLNSFCYYFFVAIRLNQLCFRFVLIADVFCVHNKGAPLQHNIISVCLIHWHSKWTLKSTFDCSFFVCMCFFFFFVSLNVCNNHTINGTLSGFVLHCV